MAAEHGRTMRIKYDADGAGGTAAAVIAGARVDNMTINNTMIDITDKGNAGVRTLLDDVGVKSITLSCTGIMKDDTLATLAAAAAATASLHRFEVAVGTLMTVVGEFFISSFEIGGEDGEAITFSMTLESSGTMTVS